jgi:uncharacterized membrane protein
MMYDWNGGWGSWVSMGAMMLLFTGAVIALAVWAAVWATRSSTSHRSFEDPRAVLDRRLASGEVDADGYAQARRLLDGKAAGAR